MSRSTCTGPAELGVRTRYDILPPSLRTRSHLTTQTTSNTKPRGAAPDVLWVNGRFGNTSRRDTGGSLPRFGVPRFRSVPRLCNLGSISERPLHFGPYISPFYSPEIYGDSPHAMLGPKPPGISYFLPFPRPSLFSGYPGLFRFTCYYYRGAYYKAFWADPPACSSRRAAQVLLGRK